MSKYDFTKGYGKAHLGQEALVQGAEAFFSEDSQHGRECPVVFGDLSRHLGGVLNSALDHVQRSVQYSSDSSTNSTRDQIVGHLAPAGLSLGEQLSDLEDAAKVASVPQNVSPHCALETLVKGEGPLILDRLDNTVNHAVVFSS